MFEMMNSEKFLDWHLYFLQGILLSHRVIVVSSPLMRRPHRPPVMQDCDCSFEILHLRNVFVLKRNKIS